MEREKDSSLNRRKAIRLKCLGCSEDEPSQVRHCPITGCSLYPYRSGRGKQDPKERDRAIKAHCMYCKMDHLREIIECCYQECPLYEFRGYIRLKKGQNQVKKDRLEVFTDKISLRLNQDINQERMYLMKGSI